jgi:hypothetical protein
MVRFERRDGLLNRYYADALTELATESQVVISVTKTVTAIARPYAFPMMNMSLNTPHTTSGLWNTHIPQPFFVS